MNISDKKKFILLNIGIAILILIIIGSIVLASLDHYTKHGHSIAVPSFSGLTHAEAKTLAEENNLRVMITDSIYDEEAKPGIILEQNPVSGAQVKDKRIIYLTTNAQSPEKVAFPNVQNTAYRQTLQTLEARGFKIGHISYAPSEFKNLVIDLQYRNRHIQPGTMLPKGSVVTIVLGSGVDEEHTTVVPNLSGKKSGDAISLIQQAYLNVGQVIPDATVKTKADRAVAVVYQQVPGANHYVPAGSSVTIYITLQKNKIQNTDSLIITE